jgi:hypothetical protein
MKTKTLKLYKLCDKIPVDAKFIEKKVITEPISEKFCKYMGMPCKEDCDCEMHRYNLRSERYLYEVTDETELNNKLRRAREEGYDECLYNIVRALEEVVQNPKNPDIEFSIEGGELSRFQKALEAIINLCKKGAA